MTRLLVVDDRPIVVEAIRLLIDGQHDMTVVGEASCGEDAVVQAQRSWPDVVIMDVGIPGMSCFDALRRIHGKVPGTRSIVFGGLPGDEHVARALRVGASGLVLKGRGFDELCRAIRTVALGELHYAPEALKRIEIANGRPCAPEQIRTPLEQLTRREREMLGVLAQGQSLKQAAQTLRVSYKTADNHKANLMRKLDIHDRVELARFAIRERIIPP